MQSQEEKLLWQERWHKGQTGWDQGAAHPGLPLLVLHAHREGGLPDRAAFFSAGCGRAHNEAQLARLGHTVRALDLSEEAIAEARKIYGDCQGLELTIGDLFQIETGEAKAYDAIFDRAMLCALPPDARAVYLDAMRDRLKEGGLFCAILFRFVETKSNPPYSINEAEALALFGNDFVLCYAGSLPATPVPAFIKEEWISVWRLRGAPQ
ncbi:MAG: methyltransferase domain-containing protein [Chitinophagaceae bacterium]|nr:methyltransferase domain-containing protein [Oligoflexus sp.]